MYVDPNGDHVRLINSSPFVSLHIYISIKHSVPQTSRPVAYIPVSSDFMSYSAVCFFFSFSCCHDYGQWMCITRSVTAGFGRHGMPPPAANDKGTALVQDGSDSSRDLATLTFDRGDHGACGWCGSSSSIRTPSLKFVGLAVRKTMCVSISCPGDFDLWPFDLQTSMRVRVASKVGNLPWAR